MTAIVVTRQAAGSVGAAAIYRRVSSIILVAALESHDSDVSCAREGEKLMRAAVLRGGSVEARVIDDPVPGPGQLLVRSIPGVLDSIIKGCERGTRILSVGGPPEGDLLH